MQIGRLPRGMSVVNRQEGSVAWDSPRTALRDTLEQHDVHVIAVRHGESTVNAQAKQAGVPILCGQTEAPLTAHGVEQAQSAAREIYQNLGGEAWLRRAAENPALLPVLYCSPLERARHTAEITAHYLTEQAAGLGLQIANLEPHVDSRLLEMNYGDFELAPLPEATRQEPEFFAHWDGFNGTGTDFLHRFPHGESRSDVACRVGSLLEDVAVHDQGRTVCLFAHLETIVAARTDLGPVSSPCQANASAIQNATPLILV